MGHGFVYLTAVIDWFSRYVLSHELSTTLDTGFCIEAVNRALNISKPEIFNTDQGSQFISEAFIECLESRKIIISMDGRGRALDNIFVERLWRSVKYEEVYLKDYETVKMQFQACSVILTSTIKKGDTRHYNIRRLMKYMLRTNKEFYLIVMGALPPCPRDLAHWGRKHG